MSDQTPIQEYSDPTFGELQWDSNLNRWDGILSVDEYGALELHLEPESLRGVDFTSHKRTLGEIVIGKRPDYAKLIADEFHQLYNEDWRNGPILSRQEFIARLEPYAISITYDGTVDIFFHDNDLFAGHSIIVVIMNGEAQAELFG